MYIHMQGNSKLTPLNFANILGGSNIFSAYLAQSIEANNKERTWG